MQSIFKIKKGKIMEKKDNAKKPMRWYDYAVIGCAVFGHRFLEVKMYYGFWIGDLLFVLYLLIRFVLIPKLRKD